MAEQSSDHPYGQAEQMTEGPLAGWWTWGLGADPFETMVGPFCFTTENGRLRSAFIPRRENANGSGAIHGGCLMSFADFALFSIAHNALANNVKAVTLTCNSEFLSAGTLDGGMIEAQGEVLRDTRSLVFVRGLVTQASRPVLAFSGTLKKIGA
jgi:acyl-coenzyme A thioesterase PaaI-like protein